MRTELFDYDLPRELIAQTPPERRDAARLLVVPREEGPSAHRCIEDLPDLLEPGDLLVVNDTRVLAARLFGRRATGGKVEFLLLRPDPLHPGAWTGLLRCGGALREGEEIAVSGPPGTAEAALVLVAKHGGGRWTIGPVAESVEAVMERVGKLPLPPYVQRDEIDERDALDRTRYQTVFARAPGAVAAPTAGLHLTDGLLERLAARRVGIARVTLHVGLGTFRPIQADEIEAHPMHSEPYEVPAATADAVRSTRAAGGRVIAVGTTSVRTLEASAEDDGAPRVGRGEADLYITPGYRFRAVDGMLTNFHLPRSTLLCLVSAMTGRERLFAAYAEAVRKRYRFYSYGDAMLVLPPA